MHHTGGPGWRITADTSGHMLLALYLRDVAGLTGAGSPAVSPVVPAVRTADPRQLTANVGGPSALRGEWEQWWADLVRDRPGNAAKLTPPSFPAFTGSPALQRLLQAHFGAAMSWSRARMAEYAKMAQEREAKGKAGLVRELVQDREMELGRAARSFELKLIELPLGEPRAWFVEPDRILMSQTLMDDETTFRSYVQPIVELVV